MSMEIPSSGVVTEDDGLARCWWCGGDPLYRRYHDEEWGRPVADDARLFEMLTLEGFQSGLSWITILRKRENFRTAFKSFDIESIARFNTRSIDRLLSDAGIVRHRGKIEATINNARRCAELVDELGSLARYVWSFEPDDAVRPTTLDWATLATLTTSPEATRMSKDLKRRGWSYVGPTTVYSFMEVVGLINDHVEACDFRDESERARRAFHRPVDEEVSPGGRA
jgi:DNA-3-methyladenine glycosylase I